MNSYVSRIPMIAHYFLRAGRRVRRQYDDDDEYFGPGPSGGDDIGHGGGGGHGRGGGGGHGHGRCEESRCGDNYR